MSLLRPPSIPPPVNQLLESLESGGYEAFLIGACVRALLAGAEVRDFEISTSASAEGVLALFPAAVLIDARRGRIMVPTEAGPVDVVPRGEAASIEQELARRDFTLRAIAISTTGATFDPFEGLADAEKGLLRSVGPPTECLGEDPLRALRAARLIATQDLEIDASLAAALHEVCDVIARVPAAHVRAEVSALLLGPWVSRGLELLQASGLEAAIAPGVSPRAPRIVGSVPADLELRLAAWLQGTRAVSILRGMRYPRPQVVAVERLLQLHPIDGGGARPVQETRIRRLARRAPARLQGLLALREAEIEAQNEGPAARERLSRVREVILRAQQDAAHSIAPLALDGSAVMRILGCPPGPHVGRALHHLADVVAADPSCNDPELLRTQLLAWWRAQPFGEARSERGRS